MALDGSKVKANASKRKAISYGRMQETEKRLKKEVRELLQQAEAADEEEDSRYGRDREGDELPEELQRRETRIARIRGSAANAEERAREEEAESQGKDSKEAKPKPKAQRLDFSGTRVTDHERSGWVRAGVQHASHHEPIFQLIVGQTVTQAANDKHQMVPLVEAIEEQSGQKPKEVVADSGYCSDDNLKYLQKKKAEGYVATEKESTAGEEIHAKRGAVTAGSSSVEQSGAKAGDQGWGGGVCDTKSHR